ncbi:GNAT family N-acetyltransferase [Paenisporosarcina antarctica]|uniref:N-acetyltransferase n=1 Tax=Paenisporosarcina antarctica TaxID=417367 RepID=A0A4V1AN22_9BACL|nr:GNAT family N-acetyltransferase [Paenisporosarcina antarctica]QBP41265.1 N-acetyltransferase [Paenisporosarcina antarctica]
MDKLIRLLTIDDLSYLEAMETGIKDDYVIRIFEKLVTGDNRLYGLFWRDKLVSIGGYTIFERRFAMIGRMRSDQRYRGNSLSSQLMVQVIEDVFKLPDIQWVGANTQEENLPAQRVLQKLGLIEHSTLQEATTKNVSSLENGARAWQEVYDLERKKIWINQLYVKTGAIFPYECYYAFPASEELFPEEKLMKWSFYENETATRVLITKTDLKDRYYLHTVYPWNDLMEQEGLWETIATAYRKLADYVVYETYIWMDLTKEATQSLPSDHPFVLPSSWILYGINREQRKT